MPTIPQPTDKAHLLALKFKRRMNASETRVWNQLQKLWPKAFWPQVAFGPYVADFLSTEQALCVEVDGAKHAGRGERDAKRDAFFRAHGFRVLRLSGDDVWKNPGRVVEQLCAAVGEPRPSTERGRKEGRRKREQRRKKRAAERQRAPWLPAVFASPAVLAEWRKDDPPRSAPKSKPLPGSGISRLPGHPGVYARPKRHSSTR